ncbi:MAG TPA: SAF domain-containing protein [Actinomycetes bacterium]
MFPLSNPEPAQLVPVQATAATRLGTSSRPDGRLALGLLLVLVAVLGGALFLQRAQRLEPVYVAARDLPSGTILAGGDLAVASVRLPAAELRLYLRPTRPESLTGRVLIAPVPKDALVPAAATAGSSADADTVELPVRVEPGDLAQGLRPGDRVQVLAAYSDGPRRGHAFVLLPGAEVVRVLRDADALGGPDRDTGVQVRLPSDRAALVTAAIANARIFVVKAPPRPTTPAQAPGQVGPTTTDPSTSTTGDPGQTTTSGPRQASQTGPTSTSTGTAGPTYPPGLGGRQPARPPRSAPR